MEQVLITRPAGFLALHHPQKDLQVITTHHLPSDSVGRSVGVEVGLGQDLGVAGEDIAEDMVDTAAPMKGEDQEVHHMSVALKNIKKVSQGNSHLMVVETAEIMDVMVEGDIRTRIPNAQKVSATDRHRALVVQGAAVDVVEEDLMVMTAEDGEAHHRHSVGQVGLI